MICSRNWSVFFVFSIQKIWHYKFESSYRKSIESSYHMYGTKEKTFFSDRYDLDLTKTLNSYREFYANEGRSIPNDLKQLLNILNSIPAGTSGSCDTCVTVVYKATLYYNLFNLSIYSSP